MINKLHQIMRYVYADFQNSRVAFIFIFFIGAYFFYSIIPYSLWFQFSAITPEKKTNSLDDEFWMVSHATYRMTADYTYSDVLQCKRNGEWGTISTYMSGVDNARSKTTTQKWQYGGQLPRKVFSECRIKSNIRAKTYFGVIKNHPTVYSETFSFVDPNVQSFIQQGKRFTYEDGIAMYNLIHGRSIQYVLSSYTTTTDFKKYLMKGGE